ncbi:MAG: EAL domain-containing protein [Thermoanaerobaculia bacterium]|nr:EAL domain-containing protein [Thermoanaerobaculia bacterium]
MSLLDRILGPEGISPRFRPIVNLSTPDQTARALDVVGQGPAGTTLEDPTVLSEYARRKLAEPMVDRAVAAAAIRATNCLVDPLELHLPVHASTLSRDWSFAESLADLCAEADLERGRVVVVASFLGGPVEPESLQAGVRRLRRRSFLVALPVDRDSSTFYQVLLTRPDLLRIEPLFLRGVDEDPVPRSVLQSICTLGRSLGAGIVAAGIETKEQTEILREATGVSRAFGPRFSGPRPLSELVDEGWISASRAEGRLELLPTGNSG